MNLVLGYWISLVRANGAGSRNEQATFFGLAQGDCGLRDGVGESM